MGVLNFLTKTALLPVALIGGCSLAVWSGYQALTAGYSDDLGAAGKTTRALRDQAKKAAVGAVGDITTDDTQRAAEKAAGAAIDHGTAAASGIGDAIQKRFRSFGTGDAGSSNDPRAPVGVRPLHAPSPSPQASFPAAASPVVPADLAEADKPYVTGDCKTDATNARAWYETQGKKAPPGVNIVPENCPN